MRTSPAPLLRSITLLSAALALGPCLSTLVAQQGMETILIDNKPCDMHGSARPGTKEYEQNPLKNRFVDPTQVSVLSMNDLVDGSARSDKYSPEMAVELVGYVESVSGNSVESCNCKATKSYYKDTHIELTPDAQHTGPQYRISVEVTPRMRMIMSEKYGEDWTTSTLKKELLGRMVRVQGWLFYDHSHESADFANDRDDAYGEKNRRASSWEVHPVTFIEVLSEDYADGVDGDEDFDGEGTSGRVVAPSYPPSTPPSHPQAQAGSTEHSPAEWLQIILLAMLLGMVGQLMRAIVGISKESAKVASGEPGSGFRTAELLFSLLISMAVGAVAGVLAAVSAGEWKGGEMITAFIAAGYAGTDFIEGWMKKAGTGSAPNTRSTPGAPATGTIPPDAPTRPAPAPAGYAM